MIYDYMFLADCHGLQSIEPINPLVVRAAIIGCDVNAQRRSLIGTISLEEDVKNALEDMIKTSTGQKQALELIKTSPYMLPTNKAKVWKRFMDQIPNDELDPF